MGLLDGVKKALGRTPASSDPGDGRQAAQGDRQVEREEIRVPEVAAAELMTELADGTEPKPLLLDCREHFERGQSFIPNSLHIPMNSIPYRLEELGAEEVVVYCAHGNRSYGVAGWLIQQGYRARSLKGGMVDWQLHHGPVETGYRGKA